MTQRPLTLAFALPTALAVVMTSSAQDAQSGRMVITVVHAAGAVTTWFSDPRKFDIGLRALNWLAEAIDGNES